MLGSTSSRVKQVASDGASDIYRGSSGGPLREGNMGEEGCVRDKSWNIQENIAKAKRAARKMVGAEARDLRAQPIGLYGLLKGM